MVLARLLATVAVDLEVRRLLLEPLFTVEDVPLLERPRSSIRNVALFQQIVIKAHLLLERNRKRPRNYRTAIARQSNGTYFASYGEIKIFGYIL